MLRLQVLDMRFAWFEVPQRPASTLSLIKSFMIYCLVLVFSLDLNEPGISSKLWIGGIDEKYRDRLIWYHRIDCH